MSECAGSTAASACSAKSFTSPTVRTILSLAKCTGSPSCKPVSVNSSGYAPGVSMLRLGEAASAVSISTKALLELSGPTVSRCTALPQYGKSLPASAAWACSALPTALARRTVTCTSVSSDFERLSIRNSARSLLPNPTALVAEVPVLRSFNEVNDRVTSSSASGSCGNPQNSDCSGETGTGSGAATAAGAPATADTAVSAATADEATQRIIAE